MYVYICVCVRCVYSIHVWVWHVCIHLLCVLPVCVCMHHIYECDAHVYIYVFYMFMNACLCMCERGMFVCVYIIYVCVYVCIVLWEVFSVVDAHFSFWASLSVMYTHGGLLSHSPSYSLETRILIERGSRSIAGPRALPISVPSFSVLELQMHVWPRLTSYLGVGSSCKSLCQNIKHFCPLSHLFRHGHSWYNNPGW